MLTRELVSEEVVDIAIFDLGTSSGKEFRRDLASLEVELHTERGMSHIPDEFDFTTLEGNEIRWEFVASVQIEDFRNVVDDFLFNVFNTSYASVS